MKKVLRKGIWIVGVLVLLAFGGYVVLGMVVKGFVSRDNLIAMAEGEINSKVEIGEVDFSPFRVPTTIVLREVALSPREAPAGENQKQVQVKEVRLAVSLGALLKRRVEISEFSFVEPKIAITLFKDGGNSLDDLLKSPGGKKRKKRGAGDGGKDDDDDDDEILNTESLNVYAHGFLGRMKNVGLKRGALDLTIEKTGMVVKVRELNAKLDEIDLDPAAIEKTNTARLDLAAEIEIDAVEKDVRYAELGLSGPAEVRLFDPVSGDLDLDIKGDFKLSEDSFINAQIPVVEKGWKALGKLESIGLKIGELPERAEFGRSRALSVHYKGERVTLLKPISVWFNDWEVAVLGGTWIHTQEATHQAGAEVLAGEKLSGKLRAQIGKGLDYVPNELQPILAEEVEATWFREGRLVAELKSKGELSSPSVDVRNKFPDVRDMLKKAGEQFLKDKAGDLLKDLFDRD